MLQAFEWELPADGGHWRRLARQAFRLSRAGVTAMWLPPACKGSGGASDVGYGVYDLYDLGEFNQKGTVCTKYGDRADYLRLMRTLRYARVQALPDVVLNHRLGADELEDVAVCREDPEHRGQGGQEQSARTFTRFTFPGRGDKYSDFRWDARCFTGVDWDEATHQSGLYRFCGKSWARDVDDEKGNYDYLMGDDVDVCRPEVREELIRWGNWYADLTGCGGFRLDAVKHISASFYRDWLAALRAHAGRELFAVGEYWRPEIDALLRYLDSVENAMSLFDVPLHFHLREAAGSGGRYDMRRLFEGTLVGCRPHLAVTFVDNHDTQPGQALESWVAAWFKPAAYGLLLLRAFGYPCVFWGDLYGLPTRQIGPVGALPLLMRLRRLNAHGEERDYFDHPSVIGFTREGVEEAPGSGLAFLCTCGEAGRKEMYVGQRFAGRRFRCVLGGQEAVTIDQSGCGVFTVAANGCSVYAPELTRGETVLRAAAEAVRLVDIEKRRAALITSLLRRDAPEREG